MPRANRKVWALGARSVPIWVALIASIASAGCNVSNGSGPATGLTPDRHTWFPISTGSSHEMGRSLTEGKMECQSCHPTDTTSFSQIMCVGCHGHEQTVTDRLHMTVGSYGYGNSEACYSCHPTGGKTPFDHGGIVGGCAMCHDTGNQFAALPKANFTHPPTGGADCSSCHDTRDWKGATPNNSHDPAHDLLVTGQLPTYAGPAMVNLTAQAQTLPMTMNHGAAAIPAGAMSDCGNCHGDVARANYFPGAFHASLVKMGITQPTACGDCHADAMPNGFVGPMASSPARVPASGEMKHDAVTWSAGAPSRTRIVPTDCGVCHRSPSASADATWATSKSGGPTAQYHGALTAATQPVSCIDCHANSRPARVLNGGNAALPAGVQVDHGAGDLLGDCAGCHAGGATGPSAAFTSWKGARFHLAGATTPPTCLPCHAGERPTSTAAWTSPTYKNSPFDYITNAAGATHGDGQDCALCHGGPGTGAWGSTQNWAAGKFMHGASTPSAQSCIVCHSTQRPDLQSGTTAAAMATALGFDHATNGNGECLGCHTATVAGNAFTNYFNPSTRALPGGDWKGGQKYPGSSFSSSPDQSVQVTETTLQRVTPTGNVLGTTTVTDVIYNGMLHTSTIIPPVLQAGATNTPDNSKCWHCHTSSNGVVSAYRNGQYHAALTSYRATPAGPVAPFPQPTSQCVDCHSSMMPDGIVMKDGSTLWPMDHKTIFNTPIIVDGKTAARVSDIDCSNCHKSPGTTWADGIFHANLPSTAVVSDCNSCHFTLMSDAGKADTISGTTYAMKHLSKQLTFQVCQTCHPMAVGGRALLPASVDLWKPGLFHASLTAQPAACLDCHVGSQPAAFVPTQSSVNYALKAGGTASNGGQWMNHGAAPVAGKDCAACHAADAQMMGSAWNRAAGLHANVPPTGIKTCRECHGLVNGGGGVAGTKNNLPLGLTSSTVKTGATSASGVAAGTVAQINHADINVSAHDCNFCHTQVGPAPAGSARGSEWAQARFHSGFTVADPLVSNATTGRCSACHQAENPPASYKPQNHSAFSATAGTDCGACHAYPGTGTSTAPNWLGSTGMR